jgi:SAM-dependent methyltransferase
VRLQAAATAASRLLPRRLVSAAVRRFPALRRAGRPPRAHAHAHHRFTEGELLARTDEFNRNAEKHWRIIAADAAGRGHVLNKPLSTVLDSGAILYRLGLVLQELHLGVGHTVLDFAAGSCWLSSYLNRLRCRTVSVDVAPGALALGRELFSLDPRHRLDLRPLFVPYDGRALPLRAESVDRIVCFDAFHHVPNQDEVLGEMFRVLRPGGRAVFAEPGEGHSHADQSEFEMDHYGVLENDLHLDEVVEKARRAGFDGAWVKPYADPSVITFGAAEYQRFMDGDDGAYPLDDLRESLRHFFVFVLTKGTEVFDSRCPHVLRADIRLLDQEPLRAARAGDRLSLRVRVTNTGDSLWRHVLDPVGGYVMLGAHLYARDGSPVTLNAARAALPRDVIPGESADLVLALDVPARLGPLAVRMDMVSEWLTWFAQTGSPTPEYPLEVTTWPDSRDPHRLLARIEPGETGFRGVKPGADVEVPLRLTNAGDTLWLDGEVGRPGTVSIGGHLYDAAGNMVEHEFFRAPLWRALEPGASAEGRARFAAPPSGGRYRVELDLVAQGVCWFAHQGSPTAWLDVEVTDEVPDSRAPGLLRAEIVVTEGATLTAPSGGTARLRTRVTNTGNTLWLNERRPEGGYVALGGRLRLGDEAPVDYLRVPLARAVPPGESVEIQAEIPAPSRPGRYRLELDMVDEGIVWFGQKGSATFEVELLVS